MLINRYKLALRIIIYLMLPFALLGCDSREQAVSETPQFSDKASGVDAQVEYIFSVHPLHNPTRLHTIFSPVFDYLSENIEGAMFKLEASRNYAAYDKKLYARQHHFSLPNPFQTINSLKHGYRVFGKMGDDDNFRGIILVRKDSGINKVSDLKGKVISYPAPTALAATMMPQYYLNSNGIDVMKDVENRYVGSQESSIMNVFLGNSAAGATWPPPWQALVKERPELAEQIEVIWQTKPLLNNGLVVRDDVPDEIVAQVSTLLFELHTHKKGKQWLDKMELSKFETATNNSYQPVRDFIDVFDREIRPIK